MYRKKEKGDGGEERSGSCPRQHSVWVKKKTNKKLSYNMLLLQKSIGILTLKQLHPQTDEGQRSRAWPRPGPQMG